MDLRPSVTQKEFAWTSQAGTWNSHKRLGWGRVGKGGEAQGSLEQLSPLPWSAEGRGSPVASPLDRHWGTEPEDAAPFPS